MRPADRPVAAVVRRTGVHLLTLQVGSQHWTGHHTEFAQLAEDIHKALQDNRIEN